MQKKAIILYLLLVVGQCFAQPQTNKVKTIHVLVALCDNKYQGIVKVPESIGNGQNPASNLYWGCGYGISTFFKRSAHWSLVKKYAIDDIKLERAIFKHKTEAYYLVADAYNGKNIKECTIDFLNSASGLTNQYITVNQEILGLYGNAQMISYIGHNGLMDFRLSSDFKNTDGHSRDVIILACASKPYFTNYLKNANAQPVLWTTHLMAPEAYTLHDALDAYISGKNNSDIQEAAAKSYHSYQKCGIKGARNLLVTGF